MGGAEAGPFLARAASSPQVHNPSNTIGGETVMVRGSERHLAGGVVCKKEGTRPPHPIAPLRFFLLYNLEMSLLQSVTD